MEQSVRNFNLIWYRNVLWGLILIGGYYVLIFLGVLAHYIGGALFYSSLICGFFFLFMRRHQLIADRYEQTVIVEPEWVELLARFETILMTQKPHLEPGFSLTAAARLVGVRPRLLSQAINTLKHTNFSDFINHHRIDLAKAMLMDPAHRHDKMIIISHHCGFGNITSFNQAFKAVTGLTPSEFKQQSMQTS